MDQHPRNRASPREWAGAMASLRGNFSQIHGSGGPAVNEIGGVVRRGSDRSFMVWILRRRAGALRGGTIHELYSHRWLAGWLHHRAPHRSSGTSLDDFELGRLGPD